MFEADIQELEQRLHDEGVEDFEERLDELDYSYVHVRRIDDLLLFDRFFDGARGFSSVPSM